MYVCKNGDGGDECACIETENCCALFWWLRLPRCLRAHKTDKHASLLVMGAAAGCSALSVPTCIYTHTYTDTHIHDFHFYAIDSPPRRSHHHHPFAAPWSLTLSVALWMGGLLLSCWYFRSCGSTHTQSHCDEDLRLLLLRMMMMMRGLTTSLCVGVCV